LILSLLALEINAQLQPVVGIDFDISSSQSVPDNWVKFVGVNWQKKSNIPLDDGTPTEIDVLITDNDTANNVTYNMMHSSGANSPLHVQGLSETLGGATMCGEAVTVIWSDLTPGVAYNIYVFASNVVSGPTTQSIKITGSGFNNPAEFTQTVASQLQVNDQTSMNQSLNNFSKVAYATDDGTIKIVIDGPGDVWLSGLAISEVIQPCVSDVVITSPVSGRFIASANITASSLIDRPVYFTAPDVELEPGFCLIQPSSVVIASDGCN